jgi:hypothetical protein
VQQVFEEGLAARDPIGDMIDPGSLIELNAKGSAESVINDGRELIE